MLSPDIKELWMVTRMDNCGSTFVAALDFHSAEQAKKFIAEKFDKKHLKSHGQFYEARSYRPGSIAYLIGQNLDANPGIALIF